MAKDHSFDIVSEVDFQEVTNAVEQAKKEIAQRYDFKDSKSTIDWNKQEKSITLHTENDFRLRSLTDVLHTKMSKRGVSIRCLEPGAVEKAIGGSVRQGFKVQSGIAQEKAKEIVKYLKQSKIKVQAQIQADQVRVQSAKIDLLQEVIGLIKRQNFGIDLQFINYR